MSGTLEVLDPRYDGEPEYWAGLRQLAGLRADWSWEVLRTQAWLGQTPLLIQWRRPICHRQQGPSRLPR